MEESGGVKCDRLKLNRVSTRREATEMEPGANKGRGSGWQSHLSEE